MILNLKAIQEMAYRNQRLYLEVGASEKNPDTGLQEAVVTTLEGTKFTIAEDLLIPNEDLAQSLGEALRCYPDEVTVNRLPVQRIEIPQLSRAYGHEEIELGWQGPPGKKPESAQLGGVLCHWPSPGNHIVSYWTQVPSENPNWQPLQEIKILPVQHLSTKDTLTLKDDDFYGFGMIGKQKGRFGEKLVKNCWEQVQRTKEHPAMPPEYRARIYRSTMTGAHIAVHAKPVVAGNGEEKSGETASLFAELYRTPQGIVPVVPVPGAPSGDKHITNMVFNYVPEPNQPEWWMQKAKSITATFWVEGEDQERTAELPYLTFGDGANPRTVAVPSKTSVAELSEAMHRAYWNGPWVKDTEQKTQHKQEMFTLALALLEGSEEAYKKILKDLLLKFQTEIPAPTAKITAQLPEQGLSITYTPSRTETEG